MKHILDIPGVNGIWVRAHRLHFFLEGVELASDILCQEDVFERVVLPNTLSGAFAAEAGFLDPVEACDLIGGQAIVDPAISLVSC
jgi:hypothetical protein